MYTALPLGSQSADVDFAVYKHELVEPRQNCSVSLTSQESFKTSISYSLYITD